MTSIVPDLRRLGLCMLALCGKAARRSKRDLDNQSIPELQAVLVTPLGQNEFWMKSARRQIYCTVTLLHGLYGFATVSSLQRYLFSEDQYRQYVLQEARQVALELNASSKTTLRARGEQLQKMISFEETNVARVESRSDTSRMILCHIRTLLADLSPDMLLTLPK